MKTFVLWNKQLKEKHPILYLWFFTTIIFFLFYYILNIYLMVTGDGLDQYSQFIYYTTKALQNGEIYKLDYITNLGFGTGFLNTFFYYCISPFNVIMLLSNWFPYTQVTNWIIIAKILTANAIMLAYIHKKFKHVFTVNEFMLLGVLLCFSDTFIMLMVNFIWYDVFMWAILLLYIIDLKTNKEIKGKDILAVALVASVMIWSNFYYATIYLLFIALYILLKKRWKYIISGIITGVLCLAPYIIGLLPNLLIKNELGSQNTVLDKVNFFDHLVGFFVKPMFSGIFAQNLASTQLALSVPFLFFFVGLIYCIKHWKEPKVILIWIAVASMFIEPLFYLLHGLQMPNGWLYRYAPLVFFLFFTCILEAIAENRETEPTSYLQLKTILLVNNSKKPAVIGFISWLVLTFILGHFSYYHEYIFYIPTFPIYVVWFLITLFFWSKNKVKQTIFMLSIGVLINTSLTFFYSFNPPINKTKTTLKVRQEVADYLNKLSEEEKLNQVYKIDEADFSNNLEVDMSNTIAFVTPVYSGFKDIAEKYKGSYKRVAYNTFYNNVINDLIFSAKYRFEYKDKEMKKNISEKMYENNWMHNRIESQKDFKDSILYINDAFSRGFVLPKGYKEPKTINDLSNLLLDDTGTKVVKLTQKDIESELQLDKINRRKGGSYPVEIKPTEALVQKLNIPEEDIDYFIEVKKQKDSKTTFNVTTSLTINKKEFLIPGKSYFNLEGSKKFMMKYQAEADLEFSIYAFNKKAYEKLPSFAQNSFDITEGQTKNQILKGYVKTPGDLIIRVPYDEKITVKVNNKEVKSDKAFNTFILVKNVKENDKIQLQYHNKKQWFLIKMDVCLFIFIFILFLWLTFQQKDDKIKNKKE